MNFSELRFLAGTLFILCFLVACDRASSPGTQVTLRMPSVAELQKGVSSLAANSPQELAKLCFGVNVKDVNKVGKPNTCDIDRGLVAGTVGPGESIVFAEVSSEPKYNFELYAFKKNQASDPCPSFATGWNWPLDKVYFLGRAQNIEVKPPVAQVDIEFRIPEASQNIVVQNSWPASCLKNTSAQKYMGRIMSGALQVSSANFQLYSKISPFNDLQDLGSNYKIRGKVSP